MGCDMHVSVEWKWKDSKQWNHATNFEVNRNYPLFAKLANVRNYNEIIPISLPRGMPENYTKETQEYQERHSNHNLTWISEDEIRFTFSVGPLDAPWRYDDKPTDFELLVFGYMRAFEKVSVYRVIVGFDN